MSKVFTAEYISKEALNVEDSIEKTYKSVTDNGTSGDSEGLAGALDGKNNAAFTVSLDLVIPNGSLYSSENHVGSFPSIVYLI